MATPKLQIDPPIVQNPSLYQDWNFTTLFSWGYSPGKLQSLLPRGLALDLADGKAWISIAAFYAANTHFPGFKPISFLSNYPQTNLRTYVLGPDGVPGIYIFTMDVGQPLLLLGRLTVNAPYCWSKMSVDRSGAEVAYKNARRWGGPGCSSDLQVAIGSQPDPSPLAKFLADRWYLYVAGATGLERTPISHEPWQLTEAASLHCRETLGIAAGIPPPDGDVVTCYAGSVSARIGKPVSL